MDKTTVTCRANFCQDVKVELDLNRYRAKTRLDRLKIVIIFLQDFTGLVWREERADDISDVPGNEEYEGFKLVNPVANKGCMFVFWKREGLA